MKSILLILLTGMLLIRTANANIFMGKNPPAHSELKFLVMCDCDTSSKQYRIQKNIEKIGGEILYRYENIGGFLVLYVASGNIDDFVAKLRLLPGVKAVEPDAEATLFSNN